MTALGLPGAPPPDPNVYYGRPVVPVAVVTIVLSTLFVGMRFWSRVVILRAIALEDGFLLLAWLFAIGTSICNVVELNYGLGRQYAVLDDETRVKNLQVGFATNLVYFFALFFVKISVLCLYIRVLTYPYVRIAAKVMLGIVAITHAWIIASILTSCIPIDALWDSSKRPGAFCHSGKVWWSHSGLNITTDFLISTLPLTVLHKLHIPRRQKVALYFVFLLGFSVCIISLLRTLQFIKTMFIDVFRDTTPDAVIISVWTMLEVNIAVICACIPTIKPVIVRFFPRFLASSGRRGGQGSTSDPWSAEMEQGRGRQYRPCADDTVDIDLMAMHCKAEDQSSTGPESTRQGRGRIAGAASVGE